MISKGTRFRALSSWPRTSTGSEGGGRSPRRQCLALLFASLAATASTGCWGNGGGPSPSLTSGAEVVNPDLANTATGDVVYCTDPSEARQDAVKRFNRAFAGRPLTAKVKELPAGTAEQRRLFVEREISCDVFDSDVIWMADLAARRRILNMTPYISLRDSVREDKGTFISTTLTTVDFEERSWGVPHTTNAGLLYRKLDASPDRSPVTWQGVYADAASKGRFVYQAADDEGLTVNYLEIAFAAGGRVLSKDERRSVINSDKNVEALRFMVDGIRNRAAPRAVLRYDEDATYAEFSAAASYMRNWPDKYEPLQRSRLRNRFDVIPLPIFEGAGVAGVLGGANLVIDADTDNQGGALALIDFLTLPEQQARGLAEFSEPAVLEETYDEPSVKAQVPFAKKLLRAIRQGRPRPVSPAYEQISNAISTNVHAALSRRVSPEEALQDANKDIEEALASLRRTRSDG